MPEKDELLESTEDETAEPTRSGGDDENDTEEEDNDMPETNTVGKLKRGALIHYVDASFGGSAAAWSLIGADVEDMSVELNPDTETIKNILDETSVVDTGYSPSFDVDTYYADPSNGDFYTKIKNIAMNRLTGDECKTKVLEVIVDKTTGPFDAWVEDVIVKPTSYGGAQGGVRIPYTVTFCGNRVPGTATLTANKVPTFTATT
ncbi:MAG: hypothetical protein Q4A05_04775 [Ruminococcus sp.]|nr:hypothetical protein [Ruminococcus sp.]